MKSLQSYGAGRLQHDNEVAGGKNKMEASFS